MRVTLKVALYLSYKSNEEENLLLDQAKLLTQILCERDPFAPFAFATKNPFFLQVFFLFAAERRRRAKRDELLLQQLRQFAGTTHKKSTEKVV